MADATYVVQTLRSAAPVAGAPDEEVLFWQDIATVTVPARTKRKGIIGRALVEAGVKPEVGGDPLKVRVLDVASFHATEVVAKQPEPTLEIG